MNRRERPMRGEFYPQRRRTPSFSSSLLDAICRSLDESKPKLDEDQHLGLHKETQFFKQSNFSYSHGVYAENGGVKEKMNLGRAVMIEDWMEKQSSRSSHSSLLFNSTSSSSECSSGGVFSSSETETSYKQRPRAKSERAQKNTKSERKNPEKKQPQKPQRENGFARTKLRALKMYGELNQKVKQPISPGSRIASFLSSIFNSGNVKKAKMCYVGAVEDVSFEHKSKSPCFSSSSTSSFSRRSCMSKTPSSAKANKPGNSVVKRSVKFYPYKVILGEEESQPSVQKYIYENDPSLMPLPSFRKITRSNNSSMKELKNSIRTKGNGFKANRNSGTKKFDFGEFYNNEDEEDDEDDDDVQSCSSSDLFELDHLVGARRFQEELPVYETTNLETNKAIANGLRL